MASGAPLRKIPASVIVATRNEERRIVRCLEALQAFDEIIVADSRSTDRTQELAAQNGASVIDFAWNGRYPKKRQWCLDHLPLRHDWVFFVDADEIVTKELTEEIRALNFQAPGYFVRGAYIFEGKPLRHGLQNNKLALLDRRRMEFPVVDDLDMPGMGEIEGHYQPF
jgi:glycosyltransferase involved in cell wall biosynthesis